MLIADHDALARGVLRSALREAAVVHTAADAREALQLALYYRPSIAVIETALPPHGGIDLIGKLATLLPNIRILTIALDDQHGALAGLRGGAVGHLAKDMDSDKLARLILRAAGGEAIVPQRLIMPLLKMVHEVPKAGWRPLHSRLTTREWEIVELLSHGASTQQIAERLVLSPTTVYSHIKSFMRKLNVHSRRDAVAAAHKLRTQETINTNTTAPVKGAL